MTPTCFHLQAKVNGFVRQHAWILLVISLLLTTIIILSAILVVRSTNDQENWCIGNFTMKTEAEKFYKAAVSSDSLPCSAFGSYFMVARNGTAVDAAICTLFCNGLVTMQSMGLGGGFFMTVYDRKNKTTYTLDSREIAANSTVNKLKENFTRNAITHGGLSIAVPGYIIGMHTAWKRFGRVPWSDLIQPTIHLAAEGFTVTPSLQEAIKANYEKFGRNSTLQRLLTNPATERPYVVGETMKHPKLAETLRRLASDPEQFISDSGFRDLQEDLAAVGSPIELQELQSYRPLWRTPVRMPIRTVKGGQPIFLLHTLPPPSSGMLVGLGINMLANYGFKETDLQDCKTASLTLHRMVETMKFMYAERSYFGDIDFLDKSNITHIKRCQELRYADELQSRIVDDKTFEPDHYGGLHGEVTDHGTSHTSVLSPEGDAVSVTSTINSQFGSLEMGSRTGIIFNNEMSDFSVPGTVDTYKLIPQPNNFIEVGKRPLSSISPVVITEASTGDVRLVIGASGGAIILSQTYMVSAYNLLFGVDVKQATNIPRLHHQLQPNGIRSDDNFPEKLVPLLKSRGHVFQQNLKLSAVQAIERRCETPQSCTIKANADRRKGGTVAGY